MISFVCRGGRAYCCCAVLRSLRFFVIEVLLIFGLSFNSVGEAGFFALYCHKPYRSGAVLVTVYCMYCYIPAKSILRWARSTYWYLLIAVQRRWLVVLS